MKGNNLLVVLVSVVALGGCRAAIIPRVNPVQSSQVVAVAKEMIGKPYRYGGKSPRGFDCSGLVVYVFKQAINLRLPRTSAGLYAYSKPIPLGQEQPSDLLFFRSPEGRISHVGIYLGRGYFVHAASTGSVVRRSNGNKKYWRQRFAGVRRLIR